MEDSVPKLPAYMFSRANGSYRYKRNVPKKLVGLFGIQTKYVQLGNTYAEAMKAYPRVHAAVEALFASEANKSSGERALEIIRVRLGEDFGDLVRAERVPTMEDVDISEEAASEAAHGARFEAFTAQEEALLDLAEELELKGQTTPDIHRQIKAGKITEELLTLAKGLDEYQEFKSEDGDPGKDLRTRLTRLRKELMTALGKTKVTQIPLVDIKRSRMSLGPTPAPNRGATSACLVRMASRSCLNLYRLGIAALAPFGILLSGFVAQTIEFRTFLIPGRQSVGIP